LRTSRGLFVVFEGGDGVGKTTQVERLVRRLASSGREVVQTFEPGDTAAGQRIRALVLDPATGELSPRAEALLYAADKAHHVDALIRPALAAGAVVVCDRYVDSMLAYQGAGRVLDPRETERIARWATGDLRPHLTVLLDLDPVEAFRAKTGLDRVEAAGAEFHDRVRRSFLALATADPEHYLVLPARRSPDDLAADIARRVGDLLAAAEVSPASGRLSDQAAAQAAGGGPA